jgi:SAM-dependent methyltransferase
MAKRIENVSARRGYDLWSESYDQTPNLVVAMDSRHTVRALAARGGELILDAGCGTGRNLAELLRDGCDPIGIDFSPGMLAVASRRHPAVPLALADLHSSLPFAGECFDAVLCALIGEHLTNLSAVLMEFHRVLKPSGRLVFSAYHPAMAEAGKEANFQVGDIEYRLGAVRHSAEDYHGAITGAGFRDIERREYSGDPDLARAVGAAAKYLGFPVLLLFKAVK